MNIDTLLANEGMSECFEIGCMYAAADYQVDWQGCECPASDEHNCPRLKYEQHES